jgi:tetratricopeptide (TPR) repeat protein
MSQILRAPDRLARRLREGILSPWRAYRLGLIDRLYEVARRGVERGIDRIALLAWRIVLALNPGDRRAVSLSVGRLVELGLREEAKAFLTQRLAKHPGDFDARIDLAHLYMNPFDPEAAEDQLRRAAEIEPEHPRLLYTNAVRQRLNSNLEDSNASLERIFDGVDYEYECEVRCLYAENLIELGSTGAAIGVLEEAVRLHPRCPHAYATLSSLKYYTRIDHPQIRQILDLLDKGEVPSQSAKVFHSTLCRIYDSLGEWDQAFLHASRCKGLAGFIPDPGLGAEPMRRILSAFDQDYFSRLRRDHASRQSVGRNLIFIVGMPRSGSTLIEQILASHPEVFGGGERDDIPRIARGLRKTLNRREGFPENVRQLDVREADFIATMHLRRVAKVAGSDHAFVDKHLMNYVYVGLIATLFPGAKIIHCRRDPLDTCLSCYFQNFDALTIAHDLTLLGNTYQLYSRMMQHWKTCLDGAILDLQYENLVQAQEETVSRLLAYCDLRFDSRCLDFHNTRRVAQTASSIQVKSPIYSSSIGRWKHYRRHLQPLIGILGEGPDGS